VLPEVKNQPFQEEKAKDCGEEPTQPSNNTLEDAQLTSFREMKEQRKQLPTHAITPTIPQVISDQIINLNINNRSFVPQLVNEAVARQKTITKLQRLT
jgi:hypothetical protein